MKRFTRLYLIPNMGPAGGALDVAGNYACKKPARSHEEDSDRGSDGGHGDR